MASVTVKAIPTPLHRALKTRAARHKRSLNSEIISMLEKTIATERPLDVKAMLEREKKLLEGMAVWATPEEIDRFKREGRDEQ